MQFPRLPRLHAEILASFRVIAAIFLSRVAALGYFVAADEHL